MQPIKSWHRNYRVIAAFLLGISMCLFNMFRYLNFAQAIGTDIHIFEGYVYCGNDIPSYIGMLLGALLLLSDAPFVTTMSPYEMLRFGRKKWVLSKIIYIIAANLIYSLTMLLMTGLFSLLFSHGFIANQWSNAMVMLAERQPEFAALKFMLSFPYSAFIDGVTPYGAAGFTVLLNAAYSIFVSLCILSVNLFSDKNIGWVIGGGIHLVGYVIYSNSAILSFPVEISLLIRAVPALHFFGEADMTITVSLCVFVVLILALCSLCFKLSHRIEPFRGGEI